MTSRYAVFGHPVGQSKSAAIHACFAKQTGRDIEYQALQPGLDSFADALNDFRKRGGKGANVTVPFKMEAFELATRRSPNAELAQAANCLKFDGPDVLAENFDGSGLLIDLERNLGWRLRGKNVLLAGTGGAARGVLPSLLGAGPSRVLLAGLEAKDAQVICARLGNSSILEPVDYEGIGHGAFDLVINATSASLFGQVPPLASTVFSSRTLAYDLAYGKGLTPFLALAKHNGASGLADGIGMLVEQAADAFFWWEGVRPETGPVIRQYSTDLV